MKKMMAWLTVLALLLTCLPASVLADYDFAFATAEQSVLVGGTLQLHVNRQGAALKSSNPITYISSDKKIATVDENGLVTGIKRGNVTITAKMETPGHTYRAMINLTVTQPVTSVTVEEKDMVLYDAASSVVSGLLSPLEAGDLAANLRVLVMLQGASRKLNVKMEPWDASRRGLVLTSSNPQVVAVQDDLTIFAASRGDCVVTVASQSYPDVSQSYRVMVIDPVRSIQLSAAESYLYNGDQLQVFGAVMPEYATIQTLRWASSDPSVATVDANGVVTGVRKGNVTITAYAMDGSGVSASMNLRVLQKPEAVVFDRYNATVAAGYATSLRATVLPKDADGAAMVWSSSDEQVARVDQLGNITGVNMGSCMITASCKDFPHIYAVTGLTVTEPVQGIFFSIPAMEMLVNQSYQLIWTIYPQHLQQTAVELTSSNPAVARVDANGVITSVGGGDATITVRVLDGTNRSASMHVSVLFPVESVSMRCSHYNVRLGDQKTLRAVIKPENASNQNMSWYSDNRSIASIYGYSTRPVVTANGLGTTVVHGITEDGHFHTSAYIHVYDSLPTLSIRELYLSGNEVKLSIQNQGLAAIGRVDYTIECRDIYGDPVPCTKNGSHIFTGSYRHTLVPGDVTTHGRFTFDNYAKATLPIYWVNLVITGYTLTDGEEVYFPAGSRPSRLYVADGYVGPSGKPAATPAPAAPAPEGTPDAAQ